MAEALEEFLQAPRLLLGASEAGAGSLLAALIAGRASDKGLMAILEAPADRYFAGATLEMRRLDAGPSEEVILARAAAALDEHQPDAVLVGASAGFTVEKALVDAALDRRVPVAAVVDHYWNLWQRFAGRSPAELWRYRPDVIFVPHQLCRDRLVALGCSVNRISVFRHPLLWDEFTKPSPSSRESARVRANIPPDAFVVLFVSEYGFPDADIWQWDQPPDAAVEEAATGLAQALADLPTDAAVGPCILLLRPHPSERRDWRQAVAASNGIVRLASDLSKPDLFSVADVAFGLNSMLLAEAARSGLPAYSWFGDVGYDGPRLTHFCPGVIDLEHRNMCGDTLRTARDRVAAQRRQRVPSGPSMPPPLRSPEQGGR